MALQRRLYSTQAVTVTVVGGPVVQIPVKSFSISRDRPMEPILGLGLLKGHDQAQKGRETFKFDIKCFLPKTPPIPPDFFKNLCKNTEKGVYTDFQVTPLANGTPLLKGVITNISIDSTVGDFIELGLSFQGLGNPNITDVGVDISTAPVDAGTTANATVLVYDSSEVNIGDIATGPYGTTVKSAKFSFEMPIETIAQIGSPIVGTNAVLTDATNQLKMRLISKAPYKASLNFDGTSVAQRPDTVLGRGGDLPSITIGNIPIVIQNGVLKTFSMNQSPGEIGANYSASYAGTSVAGFFAA